MAQDTLLVSFLWLLVISVAFILFILVLAPEGLAYLGRRNRQIFSARRRRLHALERRHQELSQALTQFSGARSAPYRQQLTTAQEALQKAAAARDKAADILRQAQVPQVPSDRRPIDHFLFNLPQAVAIPQTSVQLWRMDRLLQNGEEALQTAEANVRGLDAMPEEIRQRHAELERQRVPQLQRRLDTERQAGLNGLSPLQDRLQQIRADVDRLTPEVAGADGHSIEENDRLADTLENLDTRTEALNRALAELQLARERTDTALQNLRGQVAPLQEQPLPEPLQPVGQALSDLLQAAQAARDTRHFEDAAALVAVGENLSNLAQTLIKLQNQRPELSQMGRVRDIAPAVTAWAQRWAALLATLRQALAESGAWREPHVATGLQPTLDKLNENADQLGKQAADIRRQYAQSLKEAERDADKADRELQQAWRRLHDVIDLDESDPLVGDYQALHRRREAVREDPVALAAFVEEAGKFTEELDALHRFFKEVKSSLREYNQAARAAVNRAEELASDWPSLQPSIYQIQMEADAVDETVPAFASARTIADASEAWEQLNAHDERLAELQADLETRAENLWALEEHIDTVVRGARSPESELDPAHVERIMSLVQRFYKQARDAQDYDDAYANMQRAADYADQLGVA